MSAGLPDVTPVAAPLTDEGRIEVERGFTIAYRVFGEGSKALVGLHGGPGASSRALDRLAETVGDGRKLVLYDQLGGGDSDRPDDPSLWQVPRFIEEVETVRSALDLGVVTLYGQSWGGMLALAYTLDHPDNVNALVLSNTSPSGKHYLLAVAEHRIALGADIHAMMLRREYDDELDAQDYRDALRMLYTQHVRRSTPYDPETSRKEFAELVEPRLSDLGPAYALWGPHEFKGTGPEAFFDVSDRLGEIRVPALVVCGWYDEASPERCHRPLADGIPDSEYVIFGQSSHLTIMEKEADAYLAVIRDFIRRRAGND
jgi:proline iminopeptidase